MTRCYEDVVYVPIMKEGRLSRKGMKNYAGERRRVTGKIDILSLALFSVARRMVCL